VPLLLCRAKLVTVPCRKSCGVVGSSTAKCKEVRISIIEKILSDRGIHHSSEILYGNRAADMPVRMLFVQFNSKSITKITVLEIYRLALQQAILQTV
jgi:hypothetical protein